jgi:ubiquinone/menaquinone biosynthesis C-methylase UbiE
MEDRADLRYTSRFAKYEDILTSDFKKINKRLTEINNEKININHDELNKQRFNWFDKLETSNSYYGTRYWEYPFAILAADLKPGMKVADVGCGTTPFTPYLCELVGKENVTGIDYKLLKNDQEATHSSFGVRRSFVDNIGFNFIEGGISTLNVSDNSFDVVFCISVLEHINDYNVKQEGLLEMVRALKPGGKLIITFDTGIDIPLNDPLKIISYSGLFPFSHLNLRWPRRRLIQYDSGSMDVFGLVLYKNNSEIFIDQKEEDTLVSYEANKKYLRHASAYNIPYSDLLKVKDLKGKFGILKVILKKLLNRY